MSDEPQEIPERWRHVRDNSLAYFVAHHCVGRQYDSCVNSPCPYSSIHGCQHPRHPYRAQASKEGA